MYLLLIVALGSLVLGQTPSCSTTLTPTNSVKPTIASGYRMALVATGLTKPRSIQFDTAGNLLVVQSGAGIANLAFQDDGGTCLTVKSMKTVVNSGAVSSSADDCSGQNIFGPVRDPAILQKLASKHLLLVGILG